MRFLTNSCTDPHFNMALDEFCLECLPLETPVFYLWQNSPSVIVGLNQNVYSEVNIRYIQENGIKLARRVTGGGAVYHDLRNLNYTIVGRSSNLEQDYPGYVQFVCNALRSLGVPAEMTGRNDILVEGHKVSGYAKRVWKDRLMVHGTLMYDVDLDTLSKALSVPGSKAEASGIASVHSRVANLKNYMPQGITSIHEMKDALERILSNDYSDGEVVLDPDQLETIASNAREKFGTWDWNYGRSPKADFHASHKFPGCGTIEVDFSVNKGCISNLVFSGDYLGNLSSESLAESLSGVRYERSDVLTALNMQTVGRYFDGVTADALTDLLF